MTNSNAKWQRWLSLGLPFPLVALNSWLVLEIFQYFQPLVTIFVLTALLAFILDFPVQFLQKRGVKRGLAVFLIFLLTALILVAFGLTLVPVLLQEFNEIAKVLPQELASGSERVRTASDWAVRHNLPDLNRVITEVAERLPGEFESFSQPVFSIVWETIDSISDVVLIGVLTFYMLLDGERIWDGIFQRLPFRFSPQLKQALQDNFRNYFIGQITLASILGSSLTLTFLVLKVPFGLLFGVGVGLLSLVPFGDTVGFILVSLLVASQDFWLGVKTLVISVVVDQFIDQIISPRILASFTGLRPVWVLVALLIGTKIGGLLGLLIAVPMAGFIKSAIDDLPVSTTDSSISVVESAALQSLPEHCE